MMSLKRNLNKSQTKTCKKNWYKDFILKQKRETKNFNYFNYRNKNNKRY